MSASKSKETRWGSSKTTTPVTVERAQKAPPGTVTKDKEGYIPILNPKHGEDGWRLGEKVVYSTITGDWLALAAYKEEKKKNYVPDPRMERRNVAAPHVEWKPHRPRHFFRK